MSPTLISVYTFCMVNPINVFLIDDDTSARNGLTRLLRAARYVVQPFLSADDFLNALRSSPMRACELCGCLVLDANTSGLSGVDLASELKRHGFRLPIVVVAADNDHATRQKALNMKAIGFFRKPIDGTALLDAVDWAHQSYYAEKTRKPRY